MQFSPDLEHAHLTPLEEEVLTVLSKGGAHARQVLDVITAAGGRELSEGSLYPTLSSLDKKGFVDSLSGCPDVEGKRRKRYGITPLGVQALDLRTNRREKLSNWLLSSAPRSGQNEAERSVF